MTADPCADIPFRSQFLPLPLLPLRGTELLPTYCDIRGTSSYLNEEISLIIIIWLLRHSICVGADLGLFAEV